MPDGSGAKRGTPLVMPQSEHRYPTTAEPGIEPRHHEPRITGAPRPNRRLLGRSPYVIHHDHGVPCEIRAGEIQGRVAPEPPLRRVDQHQIEGGETGEGAPVGGKLRRTV